MNNDTKTKMAAILAAAQQKAASQTKTNFAPAKPVKPAAPEVENYDNLKDMEQAVKDGKTISLLNMSNLVNDKQPAAAPAKPKIRVTAQQVKQAQPPPPPPMPVQPTPPPMPPVLQPALFQEAAPELSTYTIEDILTGCEPAEGEDSKALLRIVEYSNRSFAIVTAEKPSEDILNILRMYGTYNQNLKCGKGWIFSKRHLKAVKAKLGL